MSGSPGKQAPLVVVLDGPAGAGKSSAAKRLAKRLGVRYLDTGAMYRAFTLRAIGLGVDLRDVPALVRTVDEGQLGMTTNAAGDWSIVLDGKDVTQAIRTPEVTASIFRLADSGPVRERLNVRQRAIAQELGSFVAEGRDLGTVVFPDAPVKIYLDASVLVRARRRLAELKLPESELVGLHRDIEERDRKDMSRAVAPLKRAKDAVLVDTSDLGLEQVVDRLEQVVRERSVLAR